MYLVSPCFSVWRCFGGNTMFPGIAERLESELKAWVQLCSLPSLLWRLHKTQVVPRGLGASKDQCQSSGESPQKVATVALVQPSLKSIQAYIKISHSVLSFNIQLAQWFLTLPVWIPGCSRFGCNVSVQRKETVRHWWCITIMCLSVGIGVSVYSIYVNIYI